MKHSFKYYSFLFAALIIILFNACSALYYAPNPQNVPLFTEKNEGRLAASLTTSEYTSGINLSGAYAFSNHLGFTGNIFLVGEQGGTPFPDRSNSKGHLTDVGLIYFLPFGSQFVFESTAGFGGGKITNVHDFSSSTAKFRNYYLQPSIGIAGEHFDLALSTKYSIISYHHLNLFVNTSDAGAYPISKPYSMLEPAITVRAGWQHVKFQIQYVHSFNLTSEKFNQDYVNLNFGLYFMLTDKYSR